MVICWTKHGAWTTATPPRPSSIVSQYLDPDRRTSPIGNTSTHLVSGISSINTSFKFVSNIFINHHFFEVFFRRIRIFSFLSDDFCLSFLIVYITQRPRDTISPANSPLFFVLRNFVTLLSKSRTYIEEGNLRRLIKPFLQAPKRILGETRNTTDCPSTSSANLLTLVHDAASNEPRKKNQTKFGFSRQNVQTTGTTSVGKLNTSEICYGFGANVIFFFDSNSTTERSDGRFENENVADAPTFIVSIKRLTFSVFVAYLKYKCIYYQKH